MENQTIKILFFGDVMAKPGREAVSKALPILREELKPDSVIVNIENMAHGQGISPDTIKEALKWGADAFTTGDHAWDNEQGIPFLESKDYPIVRPANYPEGTPGRGYYTYQLGAWRIAVINLQGQVFFKNHPQNPFYYIDDLLNKPEIADADIKLIDFHADASSEKRAFGWYVDGRVSAVFGTHTHVPTADAQILTKGTGYISDVGMNGNHNSAIGMDKEASIKRFTTQLRGKRSFDAEGPLEVGALLLTINPQTGKTEDIAHVRRII